MCSFYTTNKACFYTFTIERLLPRDKTLAPGMNMKPDMGLDICERGNGTGQFKAGMELKRQLSQKASKITWPGQEPKI